MRTKRTVKPTQSLRNGRLGFELDMRVTSKLGADLRTLINDSVDHTQKFVLAEVPDRLIVTQKQFASLNDYTEEMYHVTDRMFRTKSGYVLEVQIDSEIDNIQEIDNEIQLSQAILNREEPTNDGQIITT